jgi:hypothetical protein
MGVEHLTLSLLFDHKPIVMFGRHIQKDSCIDHTHIASFCRVLDPINAIGYIAPIGSHAGSLETLTTHNRVTFASSFGGTASVRNVHLDEEGAE